MMKKVVIFVTAFLLFDRFIQHKIFVGRKQQLLALRAHQHKQREKHALQVTSRV